ncbi:MAG: hypothetical protein IPN29_08540 [Saprospiraceae bacterium]|nr:hypothetical protein [Saprospiraceae bacterium]
MKLKYTITSILLWTFASFSLVAQDSWMMHLNSIHQGYINPAYIPSHTFELSLASMGGDFNTGSLKLGDFVSRSSDGINTVSLDALSANVKEKIPVGLYGTFNTIDLGIKAGRFNIFAGQGIHYELYTSLNPTLIGIAAHGNVDYIGQTVDLGMPGGVSIYQKWYAGLSTQIGNLNIGARLNYLNGWYDMRTVKNKINLTTGAEYYELTIANDIEIKNAGIIKYNGSIEDIDIKESIDRFETYFTKNNGVSIDMGVDYQLTSSTGFFASVQNLGTINWSDGASSLTSQQTTTLKGVDIESVIDGNGTESIEDSIYDAFNLVETPGSYNASTSSRYQAGIYHQSNAMKYSGLATLHQLGGSGYYGLFLQASRRLGNNFSLGFNYNIRKSSYANVGLLAELSLGPFQAFVCTQNIWSLFQPFNLQGLSGRFGGSLSF